VTFAVAETAELARSGWSARRSTSTSPRCASRRGCRWRKFEPFQLRVTTTLRRENGEWKIVHRHAGSSDRMKVSRSAAACGRIAEGFEHAGIVFPFLMVPVQKLDD
jgi:hypothetical protein